MGSPWASSNGVSAGRSRQAVRRGSNGDRSVGSMEEPISRGEYRRSETEILFLSRHYTDRDRLFRGLRE